MVMSILACAAPAVNNIRPAIATRKERILLLASRPSLRRLDCDAATVPRINMPRIRLWFQRLVGPSFTVRQGANKAAAGLNAGEWAIFREAAPGGAILNSTQRRNLSAVSALQVPAAPVGPARAPRKFADEDERSVSGTAGM